MSYRKHLMTSDEPPSELYKAAEVGTDVPDNNVGELISRQAAIDALDGVKVDEENCTEYDIGYNDGIDFAVSSLSVLPSAEPQIIRCKDCKHWIPYDWMFSEVWQSKNMEDYPEDEIGCACSDMAMKANDFCSRAERRRNDFNNYRNVDDSSWSLDGLQR